MANYDVLSVKQTQEITAAGDIRPVLQISFLTSPSGAAGEVTVPTSSTLDQIAAAIQPEADKLEAVFSLGGPT